MLLVGGKLSSEVKMFIIQSCPTLCNPMDCNLPGSSAHGILQARIVADPKGTQDRTCTDTRGGKQLRGWFLVIHTTAQEEGILFSYGKRVRL